MKKNLLKFHLSLYSTNNMSSHRYCFFISSISKTALAFVLFCVQCNSVFAFNRTGCFVWRRVFYTHKPASKVTVPTAVKHRGQPATISCCGMKAFTYVIGGGALLWSTSPDKFRILCYWFSITFVFKTVWCFILSC